jgi:ribosomal protein S12 methylthiotransferase accessory factor
MEVVERFSGWLPVRPTAIASYRELATTGRPVLRPADHNIALLPQYHDDLPIYWVAGHDLLNDESVLVPHAAVCCAASPGAPPCYELTTSNGLASGNSLEEAICHALCELIERDAMTIAEVASSRLSDVLTSGSAASGAPRCGRTGSRNPLPRLDLDTTAAVNAAEPLVR